MTEEIPEANILQTNNEDIVVGFNTGRLIQNQYAIAIGSYAGDIPRINSLKYVVKFRTPINLIDLYGRICSKTKNKAIVELLYNFVMNNGDVCDSFTIFSRNYNTLWYYEPPLKSDAIFNTGNEIAEFSIRLGNSELVADWVNKKEGNWFSTWLNKMNSRPIPLLDDIMEIIRNFANEYIDEDKIKVVMSPAAVATMLASNDDTEDDNILDQLETYAAKCDADVAPILSYGWIIE